MVVLGRARLDAMALPWWGEQTRHDGLRGLWSAENSTRGIFFFFKGSWTAERAEAQLRRATVVIGELGKKLFSRATPEKVRREDEKRDEPLEKANGCTKR